MAAITLSYTPAGTVLSYDKGTKTFHMEASCLPDSDVMPIGTYAYQGFWIYIPASGNKKLFTEIRVVRENAFHEIGDVLWWEYQSECGEFTLKIFND